MNLIYILLGLAILCYYLEYKHTERIENDNNSAVRINTKNLSKNPYEEIIRYIQDIDYYTPVWRISLIGASIIITIFYCYLLSIKAPISNLNIFLLAVTIMYICYNLFTYKRVHQYGFATKSVEHILNKLGDNQEISNASAEYLQDYKQITSSRN